MIEVHVRGRIDRPAKEVFDIVADMGQNPTWQRGMRSCVWITETPVRVGSQYVQVATFMRREIRTTFEVVELEPGHSIRIRSVRSTFPLDITRSVEPVTDASCDVVADVAGDPGRTFWFLGPLLRWTVGRSIRRDYGRLKQLLESRVAG